MGIGMFLIVISGLLYLARKHASDQMEIARHYIALTIVEYLAEGCSKYQEENGRWPKSIDELSAFRADYADVVSRAHEYSYSLTPYDSEVGFGSLVARDQREPNRTLEIRFPISSNETWNQNVRDHVPVPTLRK